MKYEGLKIVVVYFQNEADVITESLGGVGYFDKSWLGVGGEE